MVDTIQRSIIKKYRKEIWSPFIKAIKEYNLIEENDKIAVCISGGKDSFLLAKCMQELLKHNKFNFSLSFIVMDPGYKKEIIKKINSNAKTLNIQITIFKTDIFKISTLNNNGNPCYLCARMRRGSLYSKAQELGCNKIALGHHFNDVIETVLLNMLYNGHFSSMLPILNSDHFKNMKLIRPLYFIKEKDIIKWTKNNNLEFIDCACNLTKKNIGSRKKIKELINKLLEKNENADINIFNSTKNVNMATILGKYNN